MLYPVWSFWVIFRPSVESSARRIHCRSWTISSFQLEKGILKITASDLESTLITQITLENTDGSGTIALPARLLTDTLKEFPDIPLTFEINTDNLMTVIQSENGRFTIMGQNGLEFPQIPVIKSDQKRRVEVEREVLLAGISKALFATADDELRPVMNGILHGAFP